MEVPTSKLTQRLLTPKVRHCLKYSQKRNKHFDLHREFLKRPKQQGRKVSELFFDEVSRLGTKETFFALKNHINSFSVKNISYIPE